MFWTPDFSHRVFGLRQGRLGRSIAIAAGSPWTTALVIGVALFAQQGYTTNLFGFAADAVPAPAVATVVAFNWIRLLVLRPRPAEEAG